MKRFDRWEKRLRPYAVPNLTIGLIALQAVIFFLSAIRPGLVENCLLKPQLVLEGQVWRLISFLFVPPSSVIFAIFAWYLFYLMGTALEEQWGNVKYNLFLLVGYLANVAVAFLVPSAVASNAFLYGTVFLAFAQFYPDFTLNLYFILPIKIKWLALVAWIGYGFAFLAGGWPEKLQVIASVANFLLFFGQDIYLKTKRGGQRVARRTQQVKQATTADNTCAICKISSLSDPEMDFRYCSKCEGNLCYCAQHLHNHEHVTSEKAVSRQ